MHVDHPLPNKRKVYLQSEAAGRFIIDSVFKKKWDIAYYIDDDCEFTQGQSLDIKQAIEDGIKTWLKPLGGAGSRIVRPAPLAGDMIVGQFDIKEIRGAEKANYTLGKVKVDNSGLEGVMASRKGSDEYLFTVFFYCGRKTPWTGQKGVGEGQTYHPANITKGLEVHIYLPSRQNQMGGGMVMSPSQMATYQSLPRRYFIGGTGVNKFVLLHEIGHLFGLDHTYYEEDKDTAIRKKLNMPLLPKNAPKLKRNINEKTGRIQPKSVMANEVKSGGHNRFPGLYLDDIKGMQKLYDDEFNPN